MKTIPLTQGKIALVDDEDYSSLASRKWHYNVSGYACGNMMGKRVFMHRELIKATVDLEVDHINGDTLDNRKSNLRLCTHAENMRNRKMQKNNTSGYKGVYWGKKINKWRSKIRHNWVVIALGDYETAEEAARVYDAAAIKLFGPFAKTNF